MIRKIFMSALILSIIVSGTAYGAKIRVPDESPAREPARTSGKSQFSFETDDIRVEFAGVVRDTKAKGEALNCVFSFFLVTPLKDTKLDVSSGEIFDSLGRKFEGPVGISIIGNGNPSDVIKDIPTLVWIVHLVPVNYGKFPMFARMNFTFNGKPVEMRNIKAMEWETWKQKLSELPMFEAWLETSPSAESLYSALQSSHYWTGSKVFNGHHYKVFTDEKISWNAANVKCMAMGGHLVTITSQREQDFIDSLYTTEHDEHAWIGFFREAGKWRTPFNWVTGETVTYIRWNDGSPNRYDDYYAAAMFPTNEKRNWWYNRNGNDKLYYICEWEF